jgi:hypothetical protein
MILSQNGRGVRSLESGVWSQESRFRSRESGVGSLESGVRSREAEVKGSVCGSGKHFPGSEQ